MVTRQKLRVVLCESRESQGLSVRGVSAMSYVTDRMAIAG